jgi:hypothetical protein
MWVGLHGLVAVTGCADPPLNNKGRNANVRPRKNLRKMRRST